MILVTTIHALLLFFTTAQQPPPPPPPPRPARPATSPAGPVVKGTAIITGQVRASDARPLRRAEVRLTGPGLGDGRTVTTDLEGRYEIDELPAGRFALRFSRPGYLAYYWGQRYVGEPGTPIEVARGATLDSIDAVMVRGGVISGRVIDEYGDPVSAVDIWAMQPQFFRGRRQLVPVPGETASVKTDDIGQYRVSSLPPGEYVIVARLRDSWMSDEKEPRMVSYAPSYYPGTATPGDAGRVAVGVGQEAGGMDITLVAVRAVTVSGTAFGTRGQPMTGGTVFCTQEIRGPQARGLTMGGTAGIRPDGTWKLEHVPPGDYTFRASGVAGSGRESALMNVTVSGADLEGIELRADPGALVSGTVTTDSNEPLPRGVRLTFATSSLFMTSTTVRPADGQDDGVVREDGTFLRRSFSGQVVAKLSGLPRGWAVKRITIGGRDYAGLPFELRPGQQVSEVSVVISNRFPAVSGTVTDADGRPTTEATVLLFPVDPALWHEAAANQRIARPGQSGRYRFETVRPGEYFIAAIEAMQQWQMNDPEFLDAQKQRAVRIAVREAEPLTVDLKGGQR